MEGSFSFLCLHAAVALTPLLPRAHSLLLTSGTLSPVAPLVAELGLGAKPKCQTPECTAEAAAERGHAAKPERPQVPGERQTPELGQGAKEQPATHQLEPEHQSQRLHCCNKQQQWAKSQGTQPQARHDAHPHIVSSPQLHTHHSAELQPLDPQHASPSLRFCKSPQAPALLQHTLSPGPSPSATHTRTHPSTPHKATSHHTSLAQPLLPPLNEPSSAWQKAESSKQGAAGGAAGAHGGARSQYARVHEGVELVSAPHHHTLPSRLLPLSISMAPAAAGGHLVKLDSAYDRRQDAGRTLKGSVTVCVVDAMSKHMRVIDDR